MIDYQTLIWILAITSVGLILLSGLIWLFLGHGIDKILHPEEWKNAGTSGEQIIYKTLLAKTDIQKHQILRNVYIPIPNGKTSEIDLLAVCTQGILVFECKNYAGNIYGDAKMKNWIQYLGQKKSYFYNPFLQNKSHVSALRKYLSDYPDVKIIPFVSTITRGKWKVRNLGKNDYFLGINCHLKDVLKSLGKDNSLNESEIEALINRLRPLSRPDEKIRQKHIDDIQKQFR